MRLHPFILAKLVSVLSDAYKKHRERRRISLQKWRAKNPEHNKRLSRNSRLRHREKRNKESAAWRANNPEKNLAYVRRWQSKNKDKVRLYALKNAANPLQKLKKKARRVAYYAKNRALIIKKQTEYHSKKRKSNPTFRLICSLRLRLRQLVKSKSGKKFCGIIGCSLPSLLEHLESKFSSGMNWSNYGRGNGKWVIDHRIPTSKFNHIDKDEIKKCWHFSNLQPMWNRDNCIKGAKVSEEFGNLLPI